MGIAPGHALVRELGLESNQVSDNLDQAGRQFLKDLMKLLGRSEVLKVIQEQDCIQIL